jgi:hypothetical protein
MDQQLILIIQNLKLLIQHLITQCPILNLFKILNKVNLFIIIKAEINYNLEKLL